MLLYPFSSPSCSQDLLQKNHMSCIWWEKQISSTKCLLWNDGNRYYSLYHLTSSQLAAKDCKSWSIRSYNLLKFKWNFKKECKGECWFPLQQWSDHAISYRNGGTFSLKLVKNKLKQFWWKKAPSLLQKLVWEKLPLKCLTFFKLIWKQNISKNKRSFVACWNTTLHSRSIFPTAPLFKFVKIFKISCHKFITSSIRILSKKNFKAVEKCHRLIKLLLQKWII